MVRVIFSNTFDLESYYVAHVADGEFARLESLRGGAMWVAVGEKEGGHCDTYHGPAE